jgi:hypothetical protein
MRNFFLSNRRSALSRHGTIWPARFREPIRDFFRCAVEIDVQCSSIRDCTDPRIAILEWLRRIEWRRDEGRRQKQRRRRRRRRRDAGRRSRHTPLRHSIWNECRGLRHTRRRGRGEIATRQPEATPAQVDDGGRRGDLRFELHGLAPDGDELVKTAGRTSSVPPMAKDAMGIEPPDLADALSVFGRHADARQAGVAQAGARR